MNIKVKIKDTINQASDFVTAVHMAAEGLRDERTGAFQAMADEIERRLSKVRELLEGMQEDRP